MEIFRNPYVRKTAFLMGCVMILCAAACFFFSWQAGCVVVAAGVLVLLVYFLDSRKRYAAIAQTAQQIDRLLHGDDHIELSLYDEGELSILHSELRKLVLRLREQTELLSKEKTMLADSLADISHQLRTPLTAIHLNTASLQAQTLSDEKRQSLCMQTGQQLERIDWLVASLLKLARLDAGAVVLRKEPVSLSDVVDAACRPLAIVMDIKEQMLVSDVSGSFCGDWDWTVEAVGNMVKNCTEHMQAGTLYITGRENPIYTELIIRDTGKGFAPEDLPHLFERFYKGKNSSEKSVGIGLALSQRILALENATVKAANHPEGGAQFTIRFYKGSV